MNKNDLVDQVAEKAGLNKTDSNTALDAILDVVANALKKGEEVQLVGFGSFKVRKRAARTGRHPQTGKAIQIPATNSVVFKTGKKLKDTVNG